MRRQQYNADVDQQRSDLRDEIREKKNELRLPPPPGERRTVLSMNRFTEEDIRQLNDMVQRPEYKNQQLLAKRTGTSPPDES